MHQSKQTPSTQNAKTAGKAWVAPTMSVAKLAVITESNPGGTYGDGTIFTATS